MYGLYKMAAVFTVVIFVGLCVSACLGCPDGWLQHGPSCYLFTHDEETWVGAMQVCTLYGGHLVEIETTEEDHYLSAQTNLHGGAYWIGLTDLVQEGKWQWMTSKTIIEPGSFSNWASGEPNNHFGAQNCALYDSHERQWGDTECYHHNFYICEQPSGNPGVIVG